MRIGICSYSFHRTGAAGKMDIFSFIATSKEMGCTQLDPWNAHLSLAATGADVLAHGADPGKSTVEPPMDDAFLARVDAAAKAAGLPFGCIAVDGAHIFSADPAERAANRRRALRWIEIAARLGADSVRIDAGGTAELPAAMLADIAAGYKDVIAFARARGIQVVMENHWGSSNVPENVVRILDAVPGLGYLFDTHNWAEGRQQDGWRLTAGRATCTHIKTWRFDAQGNEVTVDLKPVFARLRDAGFRGPWGVESVPEDGDELTAARQTIALIRRLAGEGATSGKAAAGAKS
ncbi:MAG: sugar phosphate isomerase/epimerase [Planctomycetes bacterium]|nr:sugar phosphate isomerase/epimerase [Planctomycetota bacterium]